MYLLICICVYPNQTAYEREVLSGFTQIAIPHASSILNWFNSLFSKGNLRLPFGNWLVYMYWEPCIKTTDSTIMDARCTPGVSMYVFFICMFICHVSACIGQ